MDVPTMGRSEADPLKVAISPGIYKNVSYDEYASWPAVRASTLNQCSRSLAHGRESEINPRADTAALAFGTAFHTLVLEPERFFSDYAIAPKVDKRTKRGKEEWQAFEVCNSSKQWISESDLVTAKRLVHGITQCRDAAALISSAKAKELSIVWRDPDTKLLCKARIDILSVLYGHTYIVDLKSTSDASKWKFRKQSESLGYYRSLAFYRWGLNVLSPADRRCALLAVEKTAPYATAVYELTENALRSGLGEMHDLLRQYARARDSGYWPAYGDDIQDMDLSPYLQKELGFN